MQKPAIGDVVAAEDPITNSGSYITVLAVFDSLDEDWGDYGELAWAQRDYDQDMQKQGEWYIVGCCEEWQGHVSYASYEVVAA